MSPAASPSTKPPGLESSEPSMMDVFWEAAARRAQAAEDWESRQQRDSSPEQQCSCLPWCRRTPEYLVAASESPSPAAGAARHLRPGPAVRAFAFGDVREEAASQDIGVIGFYYPGREEVWDTLCGSSFCGSFFDLGLDGLELEAPRSPGMRWRFRNAEAAFQALKFWHLAGEFTGLSGEMAFRRKRELKGQEDFSYAGFGSNWLGMWAVLQAKFKPGTCMANALLNTGDAFLLEHNAVPGRDRVWSDNSDGEGTNWLGLQLMLRRDLLSGKRAWTNYLTKLIDQDSGAPRDGHCQRAWQSSVRGARQALVAGVQQHMQSRQGGG